MFKKRLKGLLAILLAGSIALSSLPMSASAQINGTIELKTANNTFEIPVYDGLGEATNQKISVTQTNTDSALKDLNGAALKGKYVLVYDKTQYNNNSKYIINKDELWSVIEDVAAAENGTFDVSKAKLVRYVNYDAIIDYFTSVDLLNEVADNSDINYINERKNSGSIWKISCSVMGPAGYQIYPKKFVYGDSFDAEIKEFLNEYACDEVSLRNKEMLHITATDPSTKVNEYDGINLYGEYITMNTDKQYPVKVSDLAAKLTAEIRPTAGMTYNKDEWELWPCYTSTGCISMKSKATVADPTADIGIPHYELAEEQHRNDLLVYFKQIAIAPSLEVTTPVVGKTPSTECKILDTLGGYSVHSVEWSCGNTLLLENDEFKAGKEYTVSVVLQPDTGLQFVETTQVKINGNDATTLNTDNGTLKVSYTFEATTKATPYIKTAPTATAITYGEALSASTLKDAVVWYSESDEKAVKGTFTWKEAATKPTVADSDKTEYDVVFTPTDAENYNTQQLLFTMVQIKETM